jgi:DNA-directed RNA polymerase sigma subunit (sigma70/sigma32)
MTHYDPEVSEARREHAWRLRKDGLTYQEIGERLGVTRERVRQMVAKHERILKWGYNKF